MKIRNGFVSNSSTSSFICVVCGEQYTGQELSPSDVDCTYCENEHIMCNQHLKDMDIPDKVDGRIPAEYCPVCTFKIYAEDEMSKYLEKTRGITRDEVFAKVKLMNKRRRKLYDAEYVSYVCEKFELNDEMLMDEVRSKFANFDEYYKFITSK